MMLLALFLRNIRIYSRKIENIHFWIVNAFYLRYTLITFSFAVSKYLVKWCRAKLFPCLYFPEFNSASWPTVIMESSWNSRICSRVSPPMTEFTSCRCRLCILQFNFLCSDVFNREVALFPVGYRWTIGVAHLFTQLSGVSLLIHVRTQQSVVSM